MAQRRVLIGTPIHSWQPDAAYAFSLAQTIRMGFERDIEVRELFPGGIAILPHARNGIITAAMQHGFDDLFFIDADQDWQPEWLFQLLNHPVDVVGLAVPRKDDIEQYNVRTPRGALSLYEDKVTGLWSAPGMTIGTGFLRLSRKALTALWEASEPYTCFGSPDEHRWIFDHRPMDVGKPVKELVSEDNILGEKLLALGIKTWIDPRMTCGHYGRKRYAGNFADAARRFQAYEQEQEAKAQKAALGEPEASENVVRFKAPAGADEDAAKAAEGGTADAGKSTA